MSEPDPNIDAVRATMESAEEVDLPEGMAAPGEEALPDEDGGDMPPAPPPQDPAAAPPPEADCAQYPLNDHGNAQRFLRHFGEDILFVPRVGWFLWGGTHWKRDDDEVAVRLKAHRLSAEIAKEVWYIKPTARDQAVLDRHLDAQDVIDRIEAIARADRSADDLAALKDAHATVERARDILKDHKTNIGRRLTHARNAGNSNGIKNFLTEASAMLARSVDDLDAGDLDVNCQSGTLRFSVVDCREDGGGKVAELQVMPHDRADLITKIMPVRYDPAAKRPRFEKFHEQIQPAKAVRDFQKRWFGLCMTALTGEQKFAFNHGSGANGKSVLMDIVARIMGDYAASAKIESLTGTNRRGGGDATPDLVPLIGARFVRASEPEQGVVLQEGLVKELTGGEPIMVRALNKDFVTIYPKFKLNISGNHKPEVHGGDDGIWRRVMLIDFPVRIPEADKIPKTELDAILWEERDGIFAWLVEGLLDYLELGLAVPDVVTASTQDYREESDPFGAFLTLCCHVSGDHHDKILARDLTEAFNLWLDDQGRGTFRPQTVSKRFAALAERWKSPVTGQVFVKHKSSTMSYLGIGLSEPFGTRFRDMPRDQQGRILRNAARPAETNDRGGEW